MNPVPTETQEQATLAEWLDLIGVLWCHVPNESQIGGKKGEIRGAILKAQGVKPGVSDNLIFDPPPRYPEAKGAAIELKRRKGGRTSDEQREWIRALRERGWITAVCKGAGEAIEVLTRLGYGRRKA